MKNHFSKKVVPWSNDTWICPLGSLFSWKWILNSSCKNDFYGENTKKVEGGGGYKVEL